MTHAINGLIVPPAAAAKAALVRGAALFALGATDLAFIPLTDELHDYLATAFPAAGDLAHEEFWKLSLSASLWMSTLSTEGRVAYIETEYFGGVGKQAAAVWETGRLVYGPNRAVSGPINDALRLLGVVRTQTKDEFDVAGLGRHRHNEGWADD